MESRPIAFGTAIFQEIESEVSALEMLEEIYPSIDSCRVHDGFEAINPIGPNPIDTLQGKSLTKISAGDAVIYSNRDGTFATLTNEAPGDLDYWFEPIEVSSFPLREFTADIPGDVFPAFSNVSFPDTPSPVVLIQPADTVDPSSQLIWEASAELKARVILEFVSYNSTTNGCTFVDCVVRDDAEFSSNTETQVLMGSDFLAEYNNDGLLLRRLKYNLLVEGDAAVIAYQESQSSP